MDFQRHCLIGQGMTRYLPDLRTQLWRLPGGITSALMMMVMRLRRFLDEDKPAGPPKKKKKKKKKDSRNAVPARKGEDDAGCPSTSMVEPEDVADEASLIPASTEVPAEETKTPKKKKKQKNEDAKLEKFPVRAARGQSQGDVQGQTPEAPA